ncbi:hypothetical protein [Rubellicoccus peritrichatus]|uniref:Uncharacterized protein n=1 Tax=Rubellicoccus peritrichatus TaxID=3080537 RepID=A0AAQ3QV78_9BACT|nr:hypothetical protein [Puniceicoccus sp. CR14]WOO43171.1 hypothetical protein RZN69_08700 [Puniceicoccus sp. CR14]
MSFLGATDTPSTGSNEAERQSYDPGGPLPLGWGWNRIAVKWIDQTWNEIEYTHGRTGKSKAVSAVGVLCVGAVDWLQGVCLVNETLIHFDEGGVHSRGSNHYIELTDSKWAEQTQRLRFYFGTIDQPRDTWLSDQRKDDQGRPLHPPYSGMAYVVLEHWNLSYPGDPTGTGRLPQLEFFVRRDSSLGGSWDDQNTGADDDIDLGNMPIGPTYDLLTDKVTGAGLGSDIIVQSEWQAKWDEMTSIGYHWNHGNQIAAANIAPVLAEHGPIENHLADILSYFDGFLRLNDSGHIEPGWKLNRDFDPPVNTPTLTRDDFIEEPEIESDSGDTLTDKVTVTFKELASENWADEEGLMDEVSVSARNPHRRDLHDGETEATNLDAHYATRNDTANALANRHLQQHAEPLFKVRGKLFRDRGIKIDGSLLRPGDLVWFDYDPHGTTTLFRVIERADKDTEEVELLLEREPFFTGNIVEEPEDSRVLPTPPDVTALIDAEIIEIPAGLYNDGVTYMQPFAGRGDLFTTGYEAYMSFSDFTVSGPEARLDDGFFFPVRISVTNTNTNRYEFEFTDGRALQWLGTSFGATDSNNGTVVLYLNGEWMGLGTLHSSTTSSSPYRFDYSVSRALFGSEQQVHATNDEGWVFLKADLRPYSDTRWVTGEEIFWKLVPYGIYGSGPATGIISHTIGAFVQAPSFVNGEEPQVDNCDILIRINRPSLSDYILVLWTVDTDNNANTPAPEAQALWIEKGEELRLPIRQKGWYWISVYNWYCGILSPPMDNLDADPNTEGWWIDATDPIPQVASGWIEYAFAGGKSRVHTPASNIHYSDQLWNGVAEVATAVTAASGDPIDVQGELGHPIVIESAGGATSNPDASNNPHFHFRLEKHATFPHDGYAIFWWDAGMSASRSDDGEFGVIYLDNVYSSESNIRGKVQIPRASTWYYIMVLSYKNGLFSPVSTAPQGWVYSNPGIDGIIDGLDLRVVALEGA